MHGGKQGIILLRSAYGDAQTIGAELDAMAVSHNDTLGQQVIIERLGILDTYQHKVGIRGEDMLCFRILQQGIDET